MTNKSVSPRAIPDSLPLLITTPHSSAWIPQHILAQMLGEKAFDTKAKEEFSHSVFLAGDPYTEHIFYVEQAYHLEAMASRFVIDLNRAADNTELNGVIKMVDFAGEPLYPQGYSLSEAEIALRFQQFYQPFHANYRALLPKVDFYIDGHSMVPKGPTVSPDSQELRPALCLMTGGDAEGEAVAGRRLGVPASMARALKLLLAEHFATILKEAARAGYSDEIRLNSPWYHAGIGAFYEGHNTLGVALEFNQDLYMHYDQGKVKEEELRRLNQAFQGFARDALALAQQYSHK